MISPRSGPSALGAVAGAALVSSGIVGGLLAGTGPADAATANEAAASERAAVTATSNVCGQPPASTKALRTGQTAVTLDAATVLQAAPRSTPKATSSSARATPKATNVASATPKASASATPEASATASATAPPAASATATPKATSSATATPSPSSTGSGSASASPSPSPTGSGSASPTPKPTPTPTPTKAAVRLCLKVQPLSTSGVKPGNKAGYAIWVWPAGGAASGVSVTVSAKVAGRDVTPAFTVCPAASKQSCTVGGILKGNSDELQATVTIPGGTSAGKPATLSAAAKSSDATAPSPASASVSVAAASSPSPSGSPAPSTPAVSPAGVGASLQAGILPTVPGSTAAAATLPELPSPQSSVGSLFPTVAPGTSAHPSPYSATLPNARNVRVADAAATFPFGTRLIGGEIAGLAVLAAALAIGIVRFSLRRPRPQHGKDPSS